MTNPLKQLSTSEPDCKLETELQDFVKKASVFGRLIVRQLLTVFGSLSEVRGIEMGTLQIRAASKTNKGLLCRVG